MKYVRQAATVVAYPGNWFCERVGNRPEEDNGLLRGFVNNVVWGGVSVIIVWLIMM